MACALYSRLRPSPFTGLSYAVRSKARYSILPPCLALPTAFAASGTEYCGLFIEALSGLRSLCHLAPITGEASLPPSNCPHAVPDNARSRRASCCRGRQRRPQRRPGRLGRPHSSPPPLGCTVPSLLSLLPTSANDVAVAIPGDPLSQCAAAVLVSARNRVSASVFPARSHVRAVSVATPFVVVFHIHSALPHSVEFPQGCLVVQEARHPSPSPSPPPFGWPGW
eukprot:GGOE01045845.1.p1 GENE.GGOE01045845.1~~GGOE01045845.1.p1  ORF type:complete len:224 (-),score=0.08 GGOE01045845.1:340-1011(-)